MLQQTVKNIRLRRQEKGWSQSDLAREVGVTRQYVSKLEAGRVDRPSYNVMFRIAKALDVDLGEL